MRTTAADRAALDAFAAQADARDDAPRIVAWRHYRLAAVRCDQPFIIVPLAGEKTVHTRPGTLRAGPGEFLLVHRPAALDMENRPAGNGPYRAWFLTFPWPLVELARRFCQRDDTPLLSAGARLASTGGIAPLAAALGPCLDEEADPLQRDYTHLGLLLALARHGHGDFLRTEAPGLAPRIRLRVAAEPAHDWTSLDFESEFSLSSATLRRHLAAESTSLRAVVAEARLHHGLALLQTRDLPLKSVALACGYRSLASFRRNFRQRFGLDPDAVSV